nr:hypothetical protein [Tanacetum cinerariifolium]
MIGCKVMRTLASVEIEIILILGLTCCLSSSSSSSMRCLENVVVPIRYQTWMSTPMFVDPEISTQADGAQSSRVPIPLPENPYEAIRQIYLVGTDTESEPFENPVETKAPKSPHIVAPPTSLPDSTPPTLVPILRRTARMAMRVPPTMSLGLSASMAEEDDEEEDEEMEESSDFDSVSEDAKDEGPTGEDEDPAAGDEGLVARDEGPDMGVKSLSLGGDEAVLEGQPRAALVVETAVGEPLGLGYGALRRREIALGECRMPSVFEVGAVRDEIFFQIYRFRSLEQERVAVTFGAIWRPVLALESWAGQTDA